MLLYGPGVEPLKEQAMRLLKAVQCFCRCVGKTHGNREIIIPHKNRKRGIRLIHFGVAMRVLQHVLIVPENTQKINCSPQEWLGSKNYVFSARDFFTPIAIKLNFLCANGSSFLSVILKISVYT